MTETGGANNRGTVFSVPLTGGTPTTLCSFNGTNGLDPLGSLVLSDSTLYGMTYLGGAMNDGTLFSIPVTGAPPTTIFSFSAVSGEDPWGGLTLNGSILYGMTEYGGPSAMVRFSP